MKLSMVGFDGRCVFFQQDNGVQRILLDTSNVYDNHSSVSMGELEPAYGEGRQKEPFSKQLGNALQSLGNRNLGHILMMTLLVKELWKKTRPIRFLRVGGSLADPPDLRTAEMLELFCPDSYLWHMCRDMDGSLPRENILPLPMKTELRPLADGSFDVLFLDDAAGELHPDRIAELLAKLRPSGHFFCLTAQREIADACRKWLPKAECLPLEKGAQFLSHELSYEEWNTAWNMTPQGKLAEKKRMAAHRLEQLQKTVASLDSAGREERKQALLAAEEADKLFAEMYPFLASVEVKALSSQFREALIDWHLGNGDPARVRRCFSALLEDLGRYRDISVDRIHTEMEWDG